MSPFNQDNSKLILVHLSYFGLYDGAGNFIRNLPLQINASSEPRWSRSDPNVLYYLQGNQLKQYNVETGATSVVHAFTEYSRISGKFNQTSRLMEIISSSLGTAGTFLFTKSARIQKELSLTQEEFYSTTSVLLPTATSRSLGLRRVRTGFRESNCSIVI